MLEMHNIYLSHNFKIPLQCVERDLLTFFNCPESFTTIATTVIVTNTFGNQQQYIDPNGRVADTIILSVFIFKTILKAVITYFSWLELEMTEFI